VEAQSSQTSSTLTLFRQMLALRHQVVAEASETDFTWLTDSGEVVAFERPGVLRVIANLSANAVSLSPWLEGWQLVLSSDSLDAGTLPPTAAGWLMPKGSA